MNLPIQVVFRNMDPSPAAEAKARNHAQKLERYFKNIMSCRVVIESNHRRHNKGKIYHVCIDLTLPNAELVVSREPSEHHAHEDVYVAIRDAFNAMKRQLQAHRAKQRGQVKHHEEIPSGRVLEVFPLADYGYIGTINGREVRFNSQSVVDYDFAELEVGDPVSFVARERFAGPVATSVHVMRKNNHDR